MEDSHNPLLQQAFAPATATNIILQDRTTITVTTGAANQKRCPLGRCKSKVKFNHGIRARRLLHLPGSFWFDRGQEPSIRFLPLTARNVTQEAASVTNCWKVAHLIVGLDTVMQSTLLSGFLSGNYKRSACSIWWIPSILSALFSSLTLFALLYLLNHLYSVGKMYLLFIALVFILVSTLVMGTFRLTLCFYGGV